MLLISSLVMLAPPAAAEAVAVSNDRVGDLVVFEQNYSTTSGVPDNIWFGKLLFPPITYNSTLGYDHVENAVHYQGLPEAEGSIYISGLYPAVRTSITIDMQIKTNDNRLSVIQIGGPNVSLRLEEKWGNLYVRTYYPNSTNPEIGDTEYVHLTGGDYPQGDLLRFQLTISTDCIARTNVISVDGEEILTTPLHTWKQNDYLPNVFTAPYIHFTPSNGGEADDVVEMWLYSITQTIPVNEYVTPIPRNDIQPFGLDGPHAWHRVQNGIALINSHGGRGTIWADVGFLTSGYPGEEASKIRTLLDDGWELGIHYNTALNDKPLEDAIEIMNVEYDQIVNIFGRAPTTWCAMGNEGNMTHAKYAWSELGMVWRNGPVGASGTLVNVANLKDNVWHLWSEMSAAGLVNPVYAHRTDEDPTPVPEHSISWSNFTQWVSNYVDRGITIVGYLEYWQFAQNTGHTEISDLMVDDGKSMSFALDNIGGRSRLFIAAPWTEKVLDGDGNEVPFEEVDGGIIMDVEAGEYQVFTQSAWRQDQIDRATSPLYAAIPVVVVLAVLGGLITMLGRLKF